ncbi:hypothetical protein HJFPF1_08011 [Paramyrothecium foliicola]|nr:hypothetical protein HJFPF1_08011 [Paramyrothecium foliicola]
MRPLLPYLPSRSRWLGWLGWLGWLAAPEQGTQSEALRNIQPPNIRRILPVDRSYGLQISNGSSAYAVPRKRVTSQTKLSQDDGSRKRIVRDASTSSVEHPTWDQVSTCAPGRRAVRPSDEDDQRRYGSIAAWAGMSATAELEDGIGVLAPLRMQDKLSLESNTS